MFSHLELLEMLFAYWRETEVAEDAPERRYYEIARSLSASALTSTVIVTGRAIL
jgi:hypothetical protein